MEYCNEIEYVGRIIQRRDRNEKEESVTVVSKNGDSTYISFICPKTLLGEADIKPGKVRVKIKAHIEGRKVRNQTKDFVYRQKCIIDEIQPLNTMIEEKFGVPGKFYESPYSKVYIAGELVKVEADSSEWLRYVIKIKNPGDNDYYSYIKVSHRKIDRMVPLVIGDNVCAVCVISTSRKYIDGKANSYENLIVSDIAVLPVAAH